MISISTFRREGLPRAGSRSALPRALGRIQGAGFAALLAALACRGAGPVPAVLEDEPQAVRVRLAPVIESLIVRPVTASGVLGAKEEVPLGFKVGGVIGTIVVNEGASVQAGQLLATLELPEIAGAVAKAQAALNQAERDLTRAEALYADSVIPRSAWEGATTTAAVARADMEIVRFNQRYAAIRAPVAGTILRRAAEPGQQIAGGTLVLVLAAVGRGQVVRVGLADQDVARIAIGDRARVRFQTWVDAPVEGRVSQVAAQATPGAGTWTVEIRLDRLQTTATGGVASGLIGSVEITPARTQSVRLVPIEALIEGDADSAMVYTVVAGDSGTVAVRRRVRVAFLTGEVAAVQEGLEGIRQVITDGAPYLEDGSRVRPVDGDLAPRGGGR